MRPDWLAAVLRRMLLGPAVLALCAVVPSGGAEDYIVPLTVETGFFERRDALVSVPFHSMIPLNLCEGTLRKLNQDGAVQPFWFEPGNGQDGMLHWVLAGETDSLETLPFALRAPTGPEPDSPCGDDDVAEIVRNSRNILPNGSFETTEQTPPRESTIWHGNRQPAEWKLHDYPWRHRKLPNIKSSCRIASEDAREGRNCLRFVSELRPDSPDAKPGKPVLLIGYVVGPTVPLKPSTRYEFSFYLKITDVVRDGYISASVNYLDENKKRVFPRNYAINRLQTAFGTTRHLPDQYRNRWVRVARSGTTLPNAAFGRIEISGSLAGTACLDCMMLREKAAVEPLHVTQGAIHPTQAPQGTKP